MKNTPEAVFTLAISHLTLSADPVCNAPLPISTSPVFIISPSERVSKTKAFDEPTPATPPCKVNTVLNVVEEPVKTDILFQTFL